MKPRCVTLLAFFCLVGGAVAGQSNQVMDSLLAQPKADFADSAYLAMVGGGWIDESAEPGAAFDMAQSKGWIGKSVAAGDPVDLESFCFLSMKALKVKGGLGWSLFATRRYAYRELIAQGIANASGGPKRILSGDEVVRMLGKVSALSEVKK
ncbi:MAG: hypothetical protein M0001_14855 [Treponema sp.]|nr:hypothetical protein [Treponema sp.]